MRGVSLAGLMRAAGALTVVFSLVTLLSTNQFAVQLFTHFRLQYFVISVLLVIVFAVMRDRRYAVILFATAFINGNHVLPWYMDAPASVVGRDLKLVYANVLSGNFEHHRLLEFVDAEQPDLLVLLEVSPAWAESLAQLDASYPHRIVEPRDGNFGVALYSKYPITTGATIDSEPYGYPTIISTLDVRGMALQVISTHPMIPVSRSYFEGRNRQLGDVARILARKSGPQILVGDLNASMWDYNYRLLEARTGLRNARRGFGVTPTWPTFLRVAMIPIDHVLVSDEIGVKDIRTGPRIGSDHLPLVVTLSL